MGEGWGMVEGGWLKLEEDWVRLEEGWATEVCWERGEEGRVVMGVDWEEGWVVVGVCSCVVAELFTF